MGLTGRVSLGDIDERHGDAVPAGGRTKKKERIDAFIVRGSSIAHRTDQPVLRQRAVDFNRARLIAAQAQAVPARRVGLDFIAEHEKARQIGVIAIEAGRGGLDDIPIRKTAGGCP
jgi:hypothetical protein